MPLNEIMPKGFSSVRTGKRNIAWRSDMPATLYYVEALDGGDQSKKAEYRDQIYTWDAPFNAEPKALYKTKERFSDIDWGMLIMPLLPKDGMIQEVLKPAGLIQKREILSLL